MTLASWAQGHLVLKIMILHSSMFIKLSLGGLELYGFEIMEFNLHHKVACS